MLARRRHHLLLEDLVSRQTVHRTQGTMTPALAVTAGDAHRGTFADDSAIACCYGLRQQLRALYPGTYTHCCARVFPICVINERSVLEIMCP